jgi:hypothetical protein
MSFIKSESGAVTVDWVVLTAAIVGLGLAVMAVVSGGVEDVSRDVDGELQGVTITTAFAAQPGNVAWNGQMAGDYIAAGQLLAPGNNGAVYAHAQMLASADAPEGFNFDNPLVDTVSGHVVYTSDDGSSYAVGGEVIPVDQFDGNIIPYTT